MAENIRITDLPADATPSPTDVIPVDNVTTRKSTIVQICNVGVPIATQEEALAGVEFTKRMTPLTVAQAITARGGAEFATAAQGALATTAVQPGSLATVATTGSYADLKDTPVIPSIAGLVADTRVVAAGTGLTGGGNLSSDRTLSLNAASVASLAKADTAVQPGGLTGYVQSSLTVTGTGGLTGGGSLTTNRSITLSAPTIASLVKADTAVQPGALGPLATKTKIDIADINTTGTAAPTTFLNGLGAWTTISVGGELIAANNLSDLVSVTAARTNLGLGTLATKNAVAIADITATGTPSSTTYLRGDGTWAVGGGGGGDMYKADNLSGLANVAIARINLGLGSLATKSTIAVADITATGTPGAGNFLRGDGSWSAAGGGDMLRSNNLSDVANAATSRTNLGLGNVDNTRDLDKPLSVATTNALSAKANTISPVLTGIPTAPTATAGTSSSQLATTQFVNTAATGKANIASPTFTGTPRAPTATAGSNTTQIATTAFVTNAVAAGGGGSATDYANPVDLVDGSEASRGVGKVWRAGPYSYVELDASFSGPCVTNAAGVKLKPIPVEVSGFKIEQFGVDLTDTTTNFVSRIQNAIDNGWDEDLSFIHPSFVGKVSPWASITQNTSKLVITGDSLSFNGFDYPEGVANGGDYATNNPNGLMSWAHMTRDVIIAGNPHYLPYYEMDMSTNAVMSTSSTDGNIYRYGMNAKCVKITFSNATQALTALYDGTGSSSLLIASSPDSTAVKFDIGGETYDNLNDGTYLGYGYKIIPIPNNFFSISNVRNYMNEATKGGVLTVYGKTSSAPMVAKLTGKGGYTSAQILAEYSTLVGAHSPDVVFYMIGANDIGLGVSVATTTANIQSFITNTKAVTGSHVVLISTPPTSSHSDATSLNLSIRMRNLAIQNGCSFIDMVHPLSKVPVANWRYDNIHFNVAGDTMVYRIIKDKLFGTISENNSFRPDRGNVIGLSGIRRKIKGFSIQINLPSFSIASTTDGAQSGVTSIVGGEKLTVTPPAGYKLSSTSFDFSPTTPALTTMVDSISGNTSIVGAYNINTGAVADLTLFSVGRVALSFERVNTEL